MFVKIKRKIYKSMTITASMCWRY